MYELAVYFKDGYDATYSCNNAAEIAEIIRTYQRLKEGSNWAALLDRFVIYNDHGGWFELKA